ncbi:MAG: hypothetical protein V4642_05205 [Bacteroidota bacterium]
MNRATAFFAATFLFIFSSGALHAQSGKPEHNIGLTASVQNNQFDVLLPIWTSNSFVLAPALGMAWTEDGGSDVAAGLAMRFYTSRAALAPYFGVKGGILYASPNSGDGIMDFIFGLAGGGEYFFHEQFSMGVEAQLNIAKSDDNSGRFGAPGRITLNTASAIFATIYF